MFRSLSKMKVRRWALVTGLGLGALVAVLAPPALAQMTGGDLWGRGGCADCHGNLAAGDGDPTYPAGPNLRRTTLQPDDLRETIACGRPGTGMPYHLANAYAGTACYGMTGAVPEGTRRGIAMTAQELDMLADFLTTSVKGQARITKANCALFYGGNPNDPGCAQYN